MPAYSKPFYNNSLNMAVVSKIPIPIQIPMSKAFITFACGLVFLWRSFRKYSRKNKYKAGTEALANRKSSGIPKKYVLESPISDQWHRGNTMNIFMFRENKSSSPMVNVTTEHGIKGEVIIGNPSPLAKENTG